MIAAIVRRFRRDIATAAGLPDEDPVPPLAETLARLDAMTADVRRMLDSVPSRPAGARTRIDDLPMYPSAGPVPATPEPMA